MKFAVLYSKKDEAGINIAEQLKEFFLPHVPIIELNKESIYEEDIDKDERLKNTEFIIFATKHASKAEVPSLSLHAPGNWRSQKSMISDDSQESEGFLKNADYGGKPGKVCQTSALALKFLFQKLNENAKSADYQHKITLECTHHGPFLGEKPCCFIELGSSSEGWRDKKSARIVAKTIADFQNFKPDKEIKVCIGIGGPHYCNNFNKIQLSSQSKLAISHIIPEYQFPLNESMLQEAIQKTKENVDLVLIDWKGCGNSESRQQVINLLEKSGIPYERNERIEK